MPNSLGDIVHLFVKSQRGTVVTARSTLSLKAGEGIAGDIHANPFSPRQVLLVSQADLENLSIAPGKLSENIVISGANVEKFIPGSMLKFASGAAIRLTFYCEPCKRVAHLVKSIDLLDRHRGILGVVIADGVLISGDRFELQPNVFPVLSDVPYERFLDLLTQIPAGKVVTYKQVIVAIGVSPGYYRALPKYLQKALKDGYPAHRVVNSQGALPHGSDPIDRLLAEGVRVVDSIVCLDEYGWHESAIYSV